MPECTREVLYRLVETTKYLRSRLQAIEALQRLGDGHRSRRRGEVVGQDTRSDRFLSQSSSGN